MSEILQKTDLPREQGFLYFVGTSKDGKLMICRAVMKRGGTKKKKVKKIGKR